MTASDSIAPVIVGGGVPGVKPVKSAPVKSAPVQFAPESPSPASFRFPNSAPCRFASASEAPASPVTPRKSQLVRLTPGPPMFLPERFTPPKLMPVAFWPTATMERMLACHFPIALKRAAQAMLLSAPYRALQLPALPLGVGLMRT